ncbi:hypothetical protein AB0D04_27120, partial [Streptomyces sp. NPDC048483]
MLRRVSTVLTGAMVAGILATGAAAAAPAPEHGQRAHHSQSQSQHKRYDGDHRHARLDKRSVHQPGVELHDVGAQSEALEGAGRL